MGLCITRGQGHVNCTPCAPGSYQSISCQSTCLLCAPGSFTPQYGYNTCRRCPAGQYCPFANTSNPPSCLPGQYCPEGSLIGIICPPGFKCIGRGNPIPVKCDPGYFCTGGDALPEACPRDTYCPETCTECEHCFVPFWQSDGAAPECHVTAVLYIVVIISILFLGLLFFVIWTSIRKRNKEDDLSAAEITNLIPRPEGPKYTGL